jgi:quercetin dioxygenase-like cupin family protein
VEGVRYPVKTGDVLIFAPNEEHGAYMGPNGARVLDVFAPPRPDLKAKMGG